MSTERQKVAPAAQLFSNSSAEAIDYCGDRGYFECHANEDYHSYKNYTDCAELFHIVNDWFDVFSKKKFNVNDLKCAYGIHLERQNAALKKMTDLMKALRVGSHENLIAFQKGILLNNESLKQLLPYLNEKQFR